jgi:uncharacterized iron-regulated protein
MNFKRGFCVCLALLFALAARGEDQEDKLLRLNIGKAGLKDKTTAITAGVISSCAKGKALSFSQMIEEMDDSRFIYVGETHNSLPMHDIQLEIIRALHSQDRHLSIGLEMFPVTLQEVLNKWSLGLLTTEEFIREAEWYVTWNFNFAYYSKIFEFAKANKIPIYALNVPRDLITTIRLKGWEALSAEEKMMFPEPDLSNEDHRTLIRTIFSAADLPPQMKGHGLEMMFEGLYRAQTAWDVVMGHYAVQNSEKDGRRMVVLAGSGHLLYNLGINWRVFEKTGTPYKTVVCLEVENEAGSADVSSSFADYVWGLPEEAKPVYPSIGLSFKQFDGLENLVIDRDPIDGVAKGQDFKKGDVVLGVDGKSYSVINELRIDLSRFTWDEEVTFRLLSQGEEKEVVLRFQVTEEIKSDQGGENDRMPDR